ncbi:MAG TPA: PVC-type heme-binding CxxCH protein [Urbifossiella sp.]
MRFLSLAVLACTLTALVRTPREASALPPPPPAEFAQPQSPAKPAPFPIKMVDQGEFDPKLKGYFLPEGFRMEVLINESEVINPVGMTFGPDGTLFVMEWVPDSVTKGAWFEVKETFRFKDGTTKQVATMKKFTMDVVKEFRFNANTGKFGPPKAIIGEELPSSILYHDGWLYVTGRGTVRRWKQSRDGGPWDIREIVAQGFCGFHHHQVSGITIGNDGLLYITSGDDDNYAEGSDGSRATVLRTGAVFRCRPDGSKMETFSLGYRNPYRDLAYDDKFNWFHADNDNEDGSKFMGCRIMNVEEGSDFGWRLRYGARCCRPDDARVSVGGEVPGKMPPMIKTGRGSPAGLLIYNDTRVPQQYRDLLYYPDVFRKVVRSYKTQPDGSSFKITGEFEFLKSDDPLFRPCQMVTGPDGAIYVCDWRTDSGGAGKLSGDGVHGRIYRIRWAGTKESPALPLRGMDSWARITKLSDDKLADALNSLDLTDRVEARKELVRRGESSRNVVLAKFISGKFTEEGKLPAIGLLQSFWNADVEDFFRLQVRNDSPDVRRLVIEALGMNAKPKDPRIQQVLVKAIGDKDPTVRRAAALAMGRLGADDAAGVLVKAWQKDNSKDVFLKDAYVRGLERLGKPGIDAIVALASSSDKGLSQAVDAFITLRTRDGAAALPQLLAINQLSPTQREALVASYNNYQLEPPISLDPLANYLALHLDEAPGVVGAAVEVFAASPTGLDSPKATQVVLGLLSRPDTEVRLAAVRAVEAARLTAAAPKLLELLADALRPTAERAVIVKALRVMNEKRAVKPIQEILASNAPTALRLEALRTLAALDLATARGAAEKLLDQTDPALLSEAVVMLGATKPGAKLLAERYVAKKLPKEMFPQVIAALQLFAVDPAIAKLQSDLLKDGLLLSLQPGQAEKIRKEIDTKGNAVRGKELYLNTKVLACATCHRMEGVGGNTGPDLSRVWDSQTVEKLLESIVNPSKEIKEGFLAYRVATVDGQVQVGLKISETPKEVVLRDANGRDVRFAKADIETIVPSKLSLMPDNVVSQLSYDQFIDLLAFLKSRAQQESLRGLVVEFGVANGFTADMKSAKPEIAADTAKPATKWQTLYADPSGTVDLKSAFASASPGGLYARTFVYSAKGQTVTGAIQSEAPVRIWVNDKSAFERSAVNGTASNGETFQAALKPGWNSVLVKVSNAGKTHRMGLRFTGADLRTAGSPEPVAPAATTGGQ